MSEVQNGEGAQRRLSERKVYRSKARFIADGSLSQVQTLDISTGGVSIVAELKQEKGAACLIELILPMPDLKTATLHVWVNVVYCFLSPKEHGFKMGLQFKDLNPRDIAALATFVSERYSSLL